MKILLVGSYLPDDHKSLVCFEEVMVRSLREKGQVAELLRPVARVCFYPKSVRGLGKWLGYVDKYLIFPFVLAGRSRNADVVHFLDHSSAIYLLFSHKKKSLVTCNDLLAVRSALGQFPENRTGFFGKILQKLILKGLCRADHIACISAKTKKDLSSLSALTAGRVSVVPMGLNFDYHRISAEKAAEQLKHLSIDPESPFYLFVGGDQWYKNRLGCLDIFEKMLQVSSDQACRLVMVTRAVHDDFKKAIQSKGLTRKVVLLESVRQEDLRALYSTARGLLMPSLEEGFGWPIIEAQACGCPVFTSDKEPMSEVGGLAAVYFDPQETDEAAKKVTASYGFAEKIRKDGFENSKRFGTELMTASYIKLYSQINRQREPDR